MKNKYFRNNLTLISLLVLFVNCKTIDKSRNTFENINKENKNIFSYVTDDLKGEDPRDKFACLYPRLININLTENYKPKYPNPCYPKILVNYVIFIPDSTSQLQINFFNNSDSLISVFSPKELRKGYYFLQTDQYEFTNEQFEEIKKNDSEYSVEIKLNKKLYNYNIKAYN
jgi:hypothetical protein